VPHRTNVSKTIRKLPLVKAQTALGKQNVKYGDRFSIWRMEFFHPAMWHVARSGIKILNSPLWQHSAIWHVALGWRHWIRQVAAPCNVARGSGMTCHWITPNVRHIRILLPVSISTISLQSTCHSAPVFYPNRTALGRKKWRHVDFQYGGSPPSWILRVQ